jgi:hypothetical protein
MRENGVRKKERRRRITGKHLSRNNEEQGDDK